MYYSSQFSLNIVFDICNQYYIYLKIVRGITSHLKLREALFVATRVYTSLIIFFAGHVEWACGTLETINDRFMDYTIYRRENRESALNIYWYQYFNGRKLIESENRPGQLYTKCVENTFIIYLFHMFLK